MKIRVLAAAALATLAPLFAHAQAAAPAAVTVRPMLGLMGTFGGDKIGGVVFTDNSTQAVTAGGTAYLFGGVEVRPVGSPVSFLGTVGYHVSNAGGDNGELRFERIPVELLALVDVGPTVRLGAGLRYDSNVNMTGSGAASIDTVKWDNALGGVFRAEFMVGQHVGFEARYVAMHYTYSDTGPVKTRVDGSHGGIGINYYF